MNRILVTGANGFIGQSFCAEALRRGFQVRGATRSANDLPVNAEEARRRGLQDKGAMRSACELPVGTEYAVVGPIDGETDWSDALLGVNVVIHLAARVHVMKDVAADPLAEFLKVNLHGTVNLARQTARASVKRLVYVSSIKVNGECTAPILTLSPNPSPFEGEVKNVFTEADMVAPQDSYAVSKWEAEQALHRVMLETGLEVVILRPPLMYGPGVKGNFAQMLAVVAKGIPLPLMSVRNQRSLIYVGNLVDALITCATHPAAAGQTYLVSDGEDVSTPDLLRRLEAAMGVPSRLFPCPPALLRLVGKLAGKSEQIERLLGSLQVDSDKIRRDLNWQPPYSLQQGLQMTAEWYRTKHERACG